MKARDRVGLIRDIADVVASFNVNIVDFSVSFKKFNNDVIERQMVVEVLNQDQLKKLIERLKRVCNVMDVAKMS